MPTPTDPTERQVTAADIRPGDWVLIEGTPARVTDCLDRGNGEPITLLLDDGGRAVTHAPTDTLTQLINVPQPSEQRIVVADVCPGDWVLIEGAPAHVTDCLDRGNGEPITLLLNDGNQAVTHAPTDTLTQLTDLPQPPKTPRAMLRRRRKAETQLPSYNRAQKALLWESNDTRVPSDTRYALGCLRRKWRRIDLAHYDDVVNWCTALGPSEPDKATELAACVVVVALHDAQQNSSRLAPDNKRTDHLRNLAADLIAEYDLPEPQR